MGSGTVVLSVNESAAAPGDRRQFKRSDLPEFFRGDLQRVDAQGVCRLFIHGAQVVIEFLLQQFLHMLYVCFRQFHGFIILI